MMKSGSHKLAPNNLWMASTNHETEQRSFTVVAKGHSAILTFLFILGVIILSVGLPFCIMYFLDLIGVFIIIPAGLVVFGLGFAIVSGRTTTLTVDQTAQTVTINVKEACLKACFTSCCSSDFRGTHTFSFQDILRVAVAQNCSKSNIRIFFLSGVKFDTHSTVDNQSALHFGAIINGYLAEHPPPFTQYHSAFYMGGFADPSIATGPKNQQMYTPPQLVDGHEQYNLPTAFPAEPSQGSKYLSSERTETKNPLSSPPSDYPDTSLISKD
ncbi:hypothetical protein BLNAU_1122 [Blattamonas nauphoetae]|uniref:Transmembrane protein n=1 Tax=Blattamonas nauphoetae TaxID=2049346 RepID=A0ABQ9YK60_9EUKA|nr:hypothetical protein BLNAU_1122 [Blattamonas nauphoetae]